MAAKEGLILTRSAPLRLLTLVLFYFTQGFPLGLFFYAVPAWMAAGGASTGQVAAVVSAASLPWTLKLANGFILDRYTFLPMGRRRAWIIGAQALIVAVLLAAAVILPGPRDVLLLSAIAFAANTAVTFQDVGIDSLTIDIMAENERAKAGGIMFGAQALGIATATAAGGFLLEAYGFALAMAGLALLPLGVLAYGICIREREGERRLPWSAGQSHPHNRALQVEAWWSLLVNAFRAVILPLSLAILPVLLLRALPAGAGESFHPGLAANVLGWSPSDYTSITSAAGLAAGIAGMVIGGLLIDMIGARRSAVMLFAGYAALLAAMGALSERWAEPGVLSTFLIADSFFAVFLPIALIPICMRLCSPLVAATQFTIYMATANLGRPLGAALAAATAGAGNPVLMYYALAGAMLLAGAVMLLARFPERGIAAQDRSLGEGLVPLRD